MAYKLTFMQVFKSVRLFLNSYYEKTQLEDFNIICGSLRSWQGIFEGQDNCPTVDPAAWEDWKDGVKKTMKSLKIVQSYRDIIYDEEIAFLCFKGYLEIFLEEFSWKDVLDLLDKVKNAKHIESDPVWSDWMEAVKHVVYETKELDVSFDPFTFERRN